MTRLIPIAFALAALVGCDPSADDSEPQSPAQPVTVVGEWACISAYCNRLGNCEETCNDGKTEAYVAEHCSRGEVPTPNTSGKQPSGGSVEYDQHSKRGERGTCRGLGYRACDDSWVNETYIAQYPWKFDQACGDRDDFEIGPCPAASGLQCNQAGVGSRVCTERIPAGEVAGREDLRGSLCQTTHDCDYGEICAERKCLLRCEPAGSGGGGSGCSECLQSCRGIPGCCRGSGCICDSAC